MNHFSVLSHFFCILNIQIFTLKMFKFFVAVVAFSLVIALVAAQAPENADDPVDPEQMKPSGSGVSTHFDS